MLNQAKLSLNRLFPHRLYSLTAGQWLLTAALALILAAALAGCAPRETSYRIGAVHPLTGNGAGYGLPVERVIRRAVQDINQQWAADNRHLELIVADGKCNSADALQAAQRLVEDSGVKIIYGGSCSDETLGIAPYAEANQVLQLTPLSTSSAVSQAGDYVFRNIPGNAAAVRATVDALPPGEFPPLCPVQQRHRLRPGFAGVVFAAADRRRRRNRRR